MKVLVVSSKYPPEYSGSGNRAHNTYLRLREKYNVEYSVLCSSLEFWGIKTYDRDGVNVKRISLKFRFLNSSIPVLGKILAYLQYFLEFIPTFFYLFRNRKKFDAVHIFGNVNVTSIAVTFSKIFKKKLIVEVVNLVNDPNQDEPFFFSMFLGKGYPANTKIVTISEALENSCKEHGYFNTWCRPNPLPEKRFNSDYTKKTEDKLRLLHIGQFWPLKNQTFLIDVLSKLPDEYVLTLVGPCVESGPNYERDKNYVDDIREKVQKLGLNDRVDIQVGFVDNPEDFFKNSDIFLFPSVREALGTPVLEALACAIPCVTNDIPGVFDVWIKNGKNGFVCELDADKWAECIINASKISLEKMKEESAQILSIASTEVIDKKYNEILNERT